MARYSTSSSFACWGLFDDDWSKVTVAVEAIEIALLIILIAMWIGVQRRTPHQFEVLKWHNFGLALHFWLLYVVLIFITFFLAGCADNFTIVDNYRMAIAYQVIFWIAKNFLLATILLAIPRGLDRLRDPAAQGRRSSWHLTAISLQGFITLFTVVFLGLFIWAYQSVIDHYAHRYSRATAFPEYIYVYMALKTCWFIAALAGIGRIAHALRAAAREWQTVPGALRGWAWTLCGALFAYGFLSTFFAFWDVFGAGSLLSDEYVAQRIVELVLTTFFSLVVLLAVVQVAKGISGMLAHPDLYGFGRDGRGQNHHGAYGEDSAYFQTHNQGYYGRTVR